MRHIPLDQQTPDPAWLGRGQALVEQLKAASDATARNLIIDNNRAFWGELKPWLLALSHQKCWFSEAKDCFSHWDVEHYRPKKTAHDADGTQHEGYWWLAFDWRNLRICGNAGNRKKGTFFPLRDGSARVAETGDIRNEDPQLLDPADPDDPNLLTFDVEGKAKPTAGLSDQWEKDRVMYSIKRYNLDFPPLMDKRKALWAECWNRIRKYFDELTKYHADKTNAVAREAFKEAARDVRELMREEQECSAVARACILGTGDTRVLGLLQSA